MTFGCLALPGRNKSWWKVLLIGLDADDDGGGGDEIDDFVPSDCLLNSETYSGDRRRMGGKSLFRDRRVLLIGTDDCGRDEIIDASAPLIDTDDGVREEMNASVLMIGIGIDGCGRDEMVGSFFFDGFVREAFFVLVEFSGDDRRRWGLGILFFRGRRVVFRIWTDLRFNLDLASECRAKQWGRFCLFWALQTKFHSAHSEAGMSQM